MNTSGISCAQSYRTLRDGSFEGRCPRHFVPGYDQPVPPGQKPFSHRRASHYVSAYGLRPGLNGTKLRGIWGIRLPRRGYRIQPRVSTLGNFNLAVRPHKALPRSALVEKHPSAGLEVLKGRKICLGQSHTYRSSKRISCVFSSARNSS